MLVTKTGASPSAKLIPKVGLVHQSIVNQHMTGYPGLSLPPLKNKNAADYKTWIQDLYNHSF